MIEMPSLKELRAAVRVGGWAKEPGGFALTASLDVEADTATAGRKRLRAVRRLWVPAVWTAKERRDAAILVAWNLAGWLLAECEAGRLLTVERPAPGWPRKVRVRVTRLLMVSPAR